MGGRLWLGLALLGLTSCDDTLFHGKDLAPEEGYAADWEGVTAFMEAQCVTCHGAGGGNALTLPTGVAKDILDQTYGYVTPGKPEESYLWLVLSGADAGLVMPPSGGPLPAADIAFIEEWILAGATLNGETPLPTDADQDGFDSVVDCDDTNSAVSPEGVETCNGIDDDCDGLVDGADAVIYEAAEWYPDVDDDGFGDAEGFAIAACEDSPPEGYVKNALDCADDDEDRHPGVPESCLDTVDLNCDGSVGADATDADNDGFDACDECNDADPDISPDDPEVCNGVDDNCDGNVDEGVGLSFYPDNDGDGAGAKTGAVVACTAPLGFVATNDDCDDADKWASPDQAADPDDGFDNDCDGQVDEDGVVISHATDIQPIWTLKCAGCHKTSQPSGGLDLQTGAFGNIVDVPSDDVPTMDQVEPGDLTKSYLWHKLQNTQGTVGGGGLKMPKNKTMTDDELYKIRSWILGGAAP